MATTKQILQTAKTLDFMFDEFTRSARQQKLIAKLRGDMATHARVDQAWRTARDAKEEALATLEAQLLSTPVVDAILAELDDRKDEANKLLERVRKAQDVLETFEKVAKLATTMLTRVRAIAA